MRLKLNFPVQRFTAGFISASDIHLVRYESSKQLQNVVFFSSACRIFSCFLLSEKLFTFVFCFEFVTILNPVSTKLRNDFTDFVFFSYWNKKNNYNYIIISYWNNNNNYIFFIEYQLICSRFSASPKKQCRNKFNCRGLF